MRSGIHDHRRIWFPTDILHLPNTTKIPSVNPPFLAVTPIAPAMARNEEEKIVVCNKTGALTLQDRCARVALGVDPDGLVVIFTQQIIVPVLAFGSKFAICQIEQSAGWWSVWRPNPIKPANCNWFQVSNRSFLDWKNQLTLPNGLRCTKTQPGGRIVSFISMANSKSSINSTIFGLILRGGPP